MSTARSPQLAILLSALCAWPLACSETPAPGTRPGVPSNGATPQDAATASPKPRPGACTQAPIAGSELLFVGETFIALTRAIPRFLTELAQQAGAIASDANYRDESLSGSEIAGGALLAQYRRAAARGPVKLVLMNAGSHDLLFGGRCQAGRDARCDEVVSSTEQLFAQMSEGGVADLVFFFYPEPGGIGARIKPAMDTLRPQLQTLCETTALLRCHWLDLRPVFEGHPEYTSGDGMYPTTAGSRATANALWDLMSKNCLAP